MTDSSPADGAPVRLNSFDLMLDIEEMRVAILQLGTATRLHGTEVEQSAKARMDPHDIRLAWRQANAMTEAALTQLSSAFDRVPRRRRGLVAAVNAANSSTTTATTN